MSAIPAESRLVVEERDLHLCVLCGHRGGDWHHRRSRSVVDEHTHCPCNGILLCRTDHAWAHANPEAARRAGVIVSRQVVEPFDVPLLTYDGWWLHFCDGQGIYLHAVAFADGAPYADMC